MATTDVDNMPAPTATASSAVETGPGAVNQAPYPLPPDADNWTGGQLIAFNWVLFAFSTILVLVRLYVDLKGIRKVPWYRQIMLIVAILAFAVFGAMASISADLDMFDYDEVEFMARSPRDMVLGRKSSYISNWMYLITMYLVKFDLILLFHELAPRSHNPKTFWAIVFAWIVNIAGACTQAGWLLFGCKKIHHNWVLPPRPDCRPNLRMMTSDWSMNIFSDIVIYIIPMVIIYRQKTMTLKEKLSAATMFFLGFVNIVGAVFTMIGLLVYDHWGPTFPSAWSWVGVGVFMAILQMATALWIICLPQVKSLYRLIRGVATGSDSDDVEKNGNGSPGRRPSGSAPTISTMGTKDGKGFFRSITTTVSKVRSSRG